ncbi:MAG: bifunctional DNA-formamidopyrimidine glycosylase/DNA-(apurinic or apyrimidinic site) lyase [Gemmatimonadaceae bacterium]
MERRGKHQLLLLHGGSALHVHFRMAGDWAVLSVGSPLPRHARAVLEMTDGSRAGLVDPRALSTITFHDHAGDALPNLGMEPDDPRLTADTLHDLLMRRRVAIKVALLDQRVIAGLGNIYAAEALWSAGIDPRRPASGLRRTRCDRLLSSIRQVLALAARDPGRYTAENSNRLAVYGREGEPCRRRDGRIRRIRQSGRSTYFCPRCQR